MNSMTGFGFAEIQTQGYWFSLDLKSYNNRYLDISVNLPSSLASLEPRFRERLSSLVQRGRVEMNLKLRETGVSRAITVQRPLVEAYVEAMAEIRDAANLHEAITLNHLLQIPDLFSVETNRDPEILWNLFSPVWEQVIRDFQDFRAREGAKTQEDISRELNLIKEQQRVIGSMEGELEQQFKASLITRIQEMVQDYEENRVLTEVAVLLMRYGIHEELVRLETHLESFSELLKGREPVGKKLDFFCQEIGREINTIGSKTTSALVQHKVVLMKEALENIREQLRNVE